MDKVIKNKIKEKIKETISNKNEINHLLQALSEIEDSKSFVLGIIIGRLYNSFYYQSRKILNREPTKDEFNEFVDFIISKKSQFRDLW